MALGVIAIAAIIGFGIFKWRSQKTNAPIVQIKTEDMMHPQELDWVPREKRGLDSRPTA